LPPWNPKECIGKKKDIVKKKPRTPKRREKNCKTDDVSLGRLQMQVVYYSGTKEEGKRDSPRQKYQVLRRGEVKPHKRSGKRMKGGKVPNETLYAEGRPTKKGKMKRCTNPN